MSPPQFVVHGEQRTEYQWLTVFRHFTSLPASQWHVLSHESHVRGTNPFTGKHVVFGRVLRGYQEVIQKITEVPVDEKDRPTVPVTIANCGELMMRSKPAETEPKVEGTLSLLLER